MNSLCCGSFASQGRGYLGISVVYGEGIEVKKMEKYEGCEERGKQV